MVTDDVGKIKTIKSWLAPKTIKQLRAFLGLTDYYRKFVFHYAAMAALLTSLLAKDKFQWSEEAQVTFDSLKQAYDNTANISISQLCTTFYCGNKCLWSGNWGNTNTNHLLAYFSKNLTQVMQRSSTYARELYATIEAMNR